MEELLVITTGGTIDKVYFDDKSDYQVGEPQIGRILEELGVAFRFSVIALLRKDSLHINAEDRELLRAAIAAQPARHVLVTHGTDTMVETARVLSAIPDKTIVLTGKTAGEALTTTFNGSTLIPTATVAAPLNGAILTGTVALTASATDNVGEGSIWIRGFGS